MEREGWGRDGFFAVKQRRQKNGGILYRTEFGTWRIMARIRKG
jgi:hypothetical protein